MTTKKLDQQQKIKIMSFLIKNKPTSANVTVGQEIKKLLNLSNDKYEDLKEDVEKFITSYFENRLKD